MEQRVLGLLLEFLPIVLVNNQELNVGSDAVPFLVDWDNDGVKEILVGCSDGSIYLANGA